MGSKWKSRSIGFVQVVIGCVLFLPSETYAQVATKPIVGNLAVGYVEPMADLKESSNPGWVVSGGVRFRVDESVPFGLRLDLGYARVKVEPRSTSDFDAQTVTTIEDGYTSIGNLSLDAIYDFGGRGHVGGYVTAGIGGYSRYRTVTQKVEQGPGFCDPLVQVCQTVTTVASESETLTKVGYDLGLALTFPLHSGRQIYIESRYHWMTTDPSTQYLPISIGYRW